MMWWSPCTPSATTSISASIGTPSATTNGTFFSAFFSGCSTVSTRMSYSAPTFYYFLLLFTTCWEVSRANTGK